MTAIALTAALIKVVFPEKAKIFDMIAAVTITAGQAVYQNSAGKAALADCNAGSGAEQVRGIALNGGGAGQAISVLVEGHVAGYTLAGAYDSFAYLSATAGGLDDAPGATNTVIVGRVVALSNSSLTKVLYVDCQRAWGIGATPLSIFTSAEATGTGSSQDIAHGLGVVPRAVVFYPTDTSPATLGSYTVTPGVHDATNVKVTVTNGKKFIAVAFA